MPQAPLNMGQAKDHHLVQLDQQAGQLYHNDSISISADSEDDGTCVSLKKLKSRNLFNSFELIFFQLSLSYVNTY